MRLCRTDGCTITRRLLPGLLALCAWSALAAEPVTSGPGIDYMPSVIRSADDGARIVVFERLDPATLSGDLWLTRMEDGETVWSTPTPIIATAANERHPALLQLGPSRYALFYLKGSGSTASFRLWRATSSDGIHFSEQNQLDLGWTTGGEVNPHVIRHVDGTLTMSYQRLGAGSYVARSSDEGITWDNQKTLIAAGSQLPRIALRESDQLYLASYQVGSTALSIHIKTTADVRDWSGAASLFADGGNHHDSLPVVMPDGAFALFWIRQIGSSFDLAVRRSLDGGTWENTIALTQSPGEDDVEPHPLVGDSARWVELYWGRSRDGGAAYDIVREPHVMVVDGLPFADGFESVTH